MKIIKVTLASLLLMPVSVPDVPAQAVEVSKPKAVSVKTLEIKKPKKKKVVALKRASRSAMRSFARRYAIVKMKKEYNWGLNQFKCLDKIWEHESHWQWDARNKRSGALGIPQAYPGHKMKSAGKDYKTNYKTQIDWGLKYINVRYGSPCRAKSYRHRHGYY